MDKVKQDINNQRKEHLKKIEENNKKLQEIIRKHIDDITQLAAFLMPYANLYKMKINFETDTGIARGEIIQRGLKLLGEMSLSASNLIEGQIEEYHEKKEQKSTNQDQISQGQREIPPKLGRKKDIQYVGYPLGKR